MHNLFAAECKQYGIIIVPNERLEVDTFLTGWPGSWFLQHRYGMLRSELSYAVAVEVGRCTVALEPCRLTDSLHRRAAHEAAVKWAVTRLGLRAPVDVLADVPLRVAALDAVRVVG